MRIGHLLAATGLITGGVMTSATAATADAIVPIGPDQAFHGLVNGVHDNAQIKVVCPGPTFPGQTGHPVSGQTVAVAPGPISTKGGGYTGSLGTSVVVGFAAVSSGKVLALKYYNDPQPIPTTLSLPCYGTGTVRFAPEPTSGTARSDDVAVTFVNIAV